MTARSEERVAELGRLLKAKIRTDWIKTDDTIGVSRVLLDEAYRELFDELISLLQHREAVVACMIRQVTARKADRGRKGRAY
jgi:hypothetical protein